MCLILDLSIYPTTKRCNKLHNVYIPTNLQKLKRQNTCLGGNFVTIFLHTHLHKYNIQINKRKILKTETSRGQWVRTLHRVRKSSKASR